jgi:FkbM family methyltransferase
MNRCRPFVLVTTDEGSMIVNRLDYNIPKKIECWHDPGPDGDYRYGIGQQILDTGSFEPAEINNAKRVLDFRRKQFGNGVLAIDGGANIGTHTIAWAKHMTHWGKVLSFEPQRLVFYQLAGNIVLNNCLNVEAEHMALGPHCDNIFIPQLDPTLPANFGGLEITKSVGESIGQKVSYTKNLDCVRMISIDTMRLQRLDLLKLDVEGMEFSVLLGALETIERCQPVVLMETIKSDAAKLGGMGYTVVEDGNNACYYPKGGMF